MSQIILVEICGIPRSIAFTLGQLDMESLDFSEVHRYLVRRPLVLGRDTTGGSRFA